MEKNYSKAIKLFDRSIEIKPDFWQAINNQGLAFFEKNKLKLSIQHFEKAISIQENAEPLLGLASCLRMQDIQLSVKLAKKALRCNIGKIKNKCIFLIFNTGKKLFTY